LEEFEEIGKPVEEELGGGRSGYRLWPSTRKRTKVKRT
jgi:hypothetical protein